ncbi:MAG: helix-turn-helix transcriptional regulator [Rhodospirillales bacterium]|nr:helix-turn-helix transcriptional regulator [Rhodospirillales bacterium]
MQNLPVIIGRHTKRLRKQQGWTQQALADHLEMSLDMVGRIERGQASPSLATLKLLARVLGTQPELMLVADFMPPTSSLVRERAYARLHDLLSAVDDGELDWVVSILNAVIRKRTAP